MQKQKPPFSEIVLETQSGISSVGSMSLSLSEESMPHLIAKVSGLEEMLKLIPKDMGFNDFMRDALLIVLRCIPSEAGTIFEVDHSQKNLFFRAVAGRVSDKIGKFRVPLGKGVAGYVAESKRPIKVDCVSENKEHLKAIQDAVGFDTKSMIAHPIIVQSKIYGVLELLNRIGEDQFSESDVELTNYLCEYLGKTIEIRLMMAGLYKKAKQHKKAA